MFLHKFTVRISFYEKSFIALFTVRAVNWNKRHPKNKSRPLIYWDVILLMGPAQLGGSSLGVIIAKILPASIMEIIGLCLIF